MPRGVGAAQPRGGEVDGFSGAGGGARELVGSFAGVYVSYLLLIGMDGSHIGHVERVFSFFFFGLSVFFGPCTGSLFWLVSTE